ncbi:MAG: S41 family peptidase [Bacteroidales bacterium]
MSRNINTIRKYLVIIGLSISLINVAWGQNTRLSKQEKSLEEFWQFFNQHYASFNEKGINWDSTYIKFRPLVNPKTTDGELFDILCEMVKPLNDSHVTITDKNKKRFSASRPSRILNEFAKTKEPKRKLYISMIDSTLKLNGFNKLKPLGAKYKGIPVFEYSTSNNYAYLRINRCFTKRFMMNGIFMQHQLEKIFKKFASKGALIIDIRFNPGGTDKFAFKIAGRLTNKEYVGLYKQKRIPNKENSFSKLLPFYVKPLGKSKFTKPVMLLTNDRSISAADVLALITNENPSVTIVGENTNGSYSDIYPAIFPKQLTNGFKITLSNQRYLSKSLINYEGKGLSVDHEVKNTLDDFKTMIDPVLSKALKVLENK